MRQIPVTEEQAVSSFLDRRFRWIVSPGVWFWVLCGIGLMVRIFLACSTRGTTDAELWTRHAEGVATFGLTGHSQRDVLFNHPPFIAIVMAKLWTLARAWHIEFRVLYRSLFALADVANIWLLVRILAGQPWRFLAAGLYAVTPVGLVLGAMHGNTDALVATCLLMTCLAVAVNRPIFAGVCIGIGAWIKLPALFAAPAFGFAFPRWRDRVWCATAATLVAASTYAPAFGENPELMWSRIFGYRGMLIQTSADPLIWIWGFKTWFVRIFGGNMLEWPVWAIWFRDSSHWMSLPLMAAFGFLRRRENDAHALAVTIAGSYAIFYAFTETWTFQYFAWSIPFWFVAGRSFGLAANLFGGGYIYVLYAFLCQDWLLRPEWGFSRHAPWPLGLILLRDCAHTAFAWFAVAFLARALIAERKACRSGLGIAIS